MTDPHWYTYHQNIVILTSWMADQDYSASELAYAVEKPWKFTDEFLKAKGALG
jgi:hypothetical protein